MSTTDTGQKAVSDSSKYLEALGCKVVERNYRTPRCEIDIIAMKNGCIYFVEVKYRTREYQGSGLDYINAKKQKQMRYAAILWAAEHTWDGEVSFVVAEVSAANFQVGDVVILTD